MLKTRSEFYQEVIEMLERLTPEQVEEGRKALLEWADRIEAKRRPKENSPSVRKTDS